MCVRGFHTTLRAPTFTAALQGEKLRDSHCTGELSSLVQTRPAGKWWNRSETCSVRWSALATALDKDREQHGGRGLAPGSHPLRGG